MALDIGGVLCPPWPTSQHEMPIPAVWSRCGSEGRHRVAPFTPVAGAGYETCNHLARNYVRCCRAGLIGAQGWARWKSRAGVGPWPWLAETPEAPTNSQSGVICWPSGPDGRNRANLPRGTTRFVASLALRGVTGRRSGWTFDETPVRWGAVRQKPLRSARVAPLGRTADSFRARRRLAETSS